jgi:tRNA-splicing ligase RtcB
MITGKTLIDWGFIPGSWFKDGIAAANALREAHPNESDEWIAGQIRGMAPIPVDTVSLRTNNIPFGVFLDPENDLERENLNGVIRHMDALMRVPTIKAGAVMPDACPAGSVEGTIPVGGVVACEDAIHPGFHSADICCSVAMTVFKRKDDPKKILDAVQAVTHFGPGRRSSVVPMPTNPPIFGYFSSNRFLMGLSDWAVYHFGTQGDGNHFAYVGHLKSSGLPVLVTHHGSRGLGAQLYKRGMAVAQKHTAIHAPQVPRHNAWIKASSDDGRDYWEALQVVREWTKANHMAIHRMTAEKIGNRVQHWTWNEHNFVFHRDGLYYHGKGATPSWKGYSPDDDGTTLIPLNMAESILITRHRDRKDALGFAPHGAGRNMGRRSFLRELPGTVMGLTNEDIAAEMTPGIDARFYCGKADLSEMPQAYKNAAAVRAQIEKYDLAEVVDEVIPYGSIMAGDWEADRPWRKGK